MNDRPDDGAAHALTPRDGAAARGLKPLGLFSYADSPSEVEAFVV